MYATALRTGAAALSDSVTAWGLIDAARGVLQQLEDALQHQ